MLHCILVQSLAIPTPCQDIALKEYTLIEIYRRISIRALPAAYKLKNAVVRTTHFIFGHM